MIIGIVVALVSAAQKRAGAGHVGSGATTGQPLGLLLTLTRPDTRGATGPGAASGEPLGLLLLMIKD